MPTAAIRHEKNCLYPLVNLGTGHIVALECPLEILQQDTIEILLIGDSAQNLKVEHLSTRRVAAFPVGNKTADLVVSLSLREFELGPEIQKFPSVVGKTPIAQLRRTVAEQSVRQHGNAARSLGADVVLEEPLDISSDTNIVQWSICDYIPACAIGKDSTGGFLGRLERAFSELTGR